MKIIINKGIEKQFSRTLIYKNGNQCGTACADMVTLDTNEGDTILIKLKSPDTTTATVASFVCGSKDDVLHVAPTTLHKTWNALNFILLPYSCMLLATLRLGITSETLEYVCTSMIALTALSLLCQKFSMHVPFLKKRMYAVSKL